MEDILYNVYVWSGLAFAIVLALGWRYGKQPVLNWLDGEIARIRTELDQAQKLRAEAEQTLALYKKKQVEAKQEAEAILVQARNAADQLRMQAEKDLKESLARREQQALDRIAMAESEALRDVRNAAVDMAMQVSAEILRSQMDPAQAAKLIDDAIGDLPEQMSKRLSKTA